MKQITLLFVSLILLIGSLQAQTPQQTTSSTQGKKSLVVDGPFRREIIEEKDPVPYPSVRESDVIWYRTVWRVIDLREKINHPLYYPTELMQSRKSFVQAMVEAAQAGKLTLYDTDTDEFTTELNPKDIPARFDAEDKVQRRQRMDGTDTTVVIPGEIKWEEVQELLVKEVWFFDKHYSQRFVRITGICPIRLYNKVLNTADEDEESGEKVKQQLFWVYYPNARKILANTSCFTGENEMSQTSFDDLFIKRRFSSYITAIADNQNNRRFESYTRNDFERMLKSEEVKNELLNFEHDLWEY
ncbi:MAG: gliding motility protein GldN [Prevotellaceae bacterium]|jgi:gliding motility associated protien GldN|nr:gliding motility protein GldN [Prevotellaceae bacterium]